MKNTKQNINIKAPLIEDLKPRFAFIKNNILSENLAIKIQYIIFLVDLEEKYELPGAITYSVFKTIVIYTASIIEAVLCYTIEKAINEKKHDTLYKDTISYKYTGWKKLHKLSETEEIGGIKRTLKHKKTQDIHFMQLNRLAKKLNIFSNDTFNASENLREMRNRIHLYSLEKIDDEYTKDDINTIFENTYHILNDIEYYNK